jgi:hypothetical protein
MHGYLFMIYQQWADLLAICSQLQVVNSVFCHGAVYFRATSISVWQAVVKALCYKPKDRGFDTR